MIQLIKINKMRSFSMKVLFKNHTQYTHQVYDDFLAFHHDKYHFRYQLYTFMVCLAFLFCLVLQVYYHYYSVAFLFCIGLTSFLLWRFLHPIHEVKKERESEKIQKEEKFTFRFFEKQVEVSNRKEYCKVSYGKIKHVFETPEYFYLYIDKTHSFLLAKNGFCVGSSEDFSLFIQRKCLFRYHLANYDDPSKIKRSKRPKRQNLDDK